MPVARQLSCWSLIAGTLLSSLVFANAFEDGFGAGARSRAMGNVGVANSNDYSGVFYNPANLSFCDRSQLTLEYSQIGSNFYVDAPASTQSLDQLGLAGIMNVGLCQKLPYHVSLGVLVGMAPFNPADMEQHTLDDRPRMLAYNRAITMPTMMAAVSYRPINQLSFGFGVSLNASAVMTQDLNVPTGVPGQDVQIGLGIKAQPRVGFVGGITAEPIKVLKLGVAYRSPMSGRMDFIGDTKVNAAGIKVNLQQFMEANIGYSPQQIAFGAAVTPFDSFQVALDATWYNWSSYPSPGPFLHVTPSETSVAAQMLSYAYEDIKFHDTFVPRVGAEYTWEKTISARAGYAYRMTPAYIPQKRANLYDTDVHHFSLGAGYNILQTKELGLKTDAYASLDYMPGTQVKKDPSFTYNDVRFGGVAWAAGLALTAEY